MKYKWYKIVHAEFIILNLSKQNHTWEVILFAGQENVPKLSVTLDSKKIHAFIVTPYMMSKTLKGYEHVSNEARHERMMDFVECIQRNMNHSMVEI